MAHISFAFRASVMDASVNVSWDIVMAWAKASSSTIMNDTSTATATTTINTAASVAGDDGQTTPLPVSITTSLTDGYLIPTDIIASSLVDNYSTPITPSVGDYSTPTVASITSLVDHDIPSPPASITRADPFTPSDNHYGEMPPSMGAMFIDLVGGLLCMFSLGMFAVITVAIIWGAGIFAVYGLGVGVHYGYRRLRIWWLQRRQQGRAALLAAAEEKQQRDNGEWIEDEDETEEDKLHTPPSSSSSSSSASSSSPSLSVVVQRGANAIRPSKLPKKKG
ncbi:hypothetical protein PG984_007723 [Apiospora sp. TS-2023a]